MNMDKEAKETTASEVQVQHSIKLVTERDRGFNAKESEGDDRQGLEPVTQELGPDRITLREVLYGLRNHVEGVPTKIPVDHLDKELKSWDLRSGDNKPHDRLVYETKDDPTNHLVIYKSHEQTNVYKERVYEGIMRGDKTTVKALEHIIEKTLEKTYEMDR